MYYWICDVCGYFLSDETEPVHCPHCRTHYCFSRVTGGKSQDTVEKKVPASALIKQSSNYKLYGYPDADE